MTAGGADLVVIVDIVILRQGIELVILVADIEPQYALADEFNAPGRHRAVGQIAGLHNGTVHAEYANLHRHGGGSVTQPRQKELFLALIRNVVEPYLTRHERRGIESIGGKRRGIANGCFVTEFRS